MRNISLLGLALFGSQTSAEVVPPPSKLRKCPKILDNEATSDGQGQPRSVRIDNKADLDLMVHWVDFSGNEMEGSILAAESEDQHSTYTGHLFRIRTLRGKLVEEYRVPSEEGDKILEVTACDEIVDEMGSVDWYDNSRDAEFDALILPKDPCLPVGQSGSWACDRLLSEEEINARPEGRWGFLKSEEKPGRKEGDTLDRSYANHVGKIPRMAPTGGFIRMKQTQHMRDVLEEWYAKESERSVDVHEPVGGDYTNMHNITCHKINLDNFPLVRTEIVKELQMVLQWWTKQQLKHTSTFGARIYRRESMLINHVDRHDTHLASVVIQIHQDTDVDGGWPLEIMMGVDAKERHEIYLQPGEMVLYEGAWAHHGRPMRFQGNEFTNIFSHFAPRKWSGLKSDWREFDFRYMENSLYTEEQKAAQAALQAAHSAELNDAVTQKKAARKLRKKPRKKEAQKEEATTARGLFSKIASFFKAGNNDEL